MKNKDLYDILGISNTASDNDIKRAYRKLALKYHPDRQGDKSDKEKKEAEEKFKEVSFAYSILSDPNKKEKYDKYGITDDQQMNGTDFDPSDIFKHFMGGFSGMFDDNPFESFFGNRNQSRRAPKQGKSIRMQVAVSIDEILNGVHRDIIYDTFVRCDKCNGTGGSGIETCPHCHGTGMITEIHQHGFGMIQNSHPCQYCEASGKIIKNKCSSCNGTGLKRKEVSVRLDIDKGFENGKQIFIPGKGYESKNSSEQNGDLLIDLIYKFDTNKFAVQNNTIYEIMDIPYYDCILGTEINHVLPNNEKIKIKIPEYTQDKSFININKKFGNLNYNIVVNVKMPTYIRQKEKDLLIQIKKENH